MEDRSPPRLCRGSHEPPQGRYNLLSGHQARRRARGLHEKSYCTDGTSHRPESLHAELPVG